MKIESVTAGEAVLLRKLQEGDERAFELLYERHQSPLYRYALRMSGSETVAEDVVQEAFLILIRGARGFDPAHGSLQSYLYGIGRNLLAQRMREPSMEGLDGVDVATESDPLDGLTREEQMEMVRKALVTLPVEYREAVVLCDLEEMSYADAAELQGCPVGTIRSRLSRAREMLTARVQELRVRA